MSASLTIIDFSELDAFLGSIKLQDKYRHTFIENGIEDLETILELNDEHLQIMKIPLGHKLKILKKIKEHQAAAKPAALPQPTKSALKTTTSHHSELVELVPPKATGVSVSTAGGALLQGTYSEQESHESFKQALADWRGGEKDPSPKKEVRFEDAGSSRFWLKLEPAGSFFANIGQSENWDGQPGISRATLRRRNRRPGNGRGHID